MNINNIATLEEAQEIILQMISGEGGHCPVCRQKVRSWRKSICSTSAADLINLVKAYNGQPLHFKSFSNDISDRNWSQLKLWELIEPGENLDRKKRASGTWRPTDLGAGFVWNLAVVPRYITTFDNKIIRRSTEQVGIQDALGNKFDYTALISAQGVA